MTSTLLDTGTLIPDHFGKAPLPIPDLYEEQEPGSVKVPERSAASRGRRHRSLRWSIPLSLTGSVVAILTACLDRHLNPGLWGLPGSINPIWYFGLALIIAGIGLARRSDGVEIGTAVTALVAVLTATSAIVYDMPRLPWAEKHVGVVNYILNSGQVHANIDIYQAWPGLFSAAAWFARAGGISDPLTIARVWPPVIDLLVLLVVRCFAGRLLSNSFRAWVAAGTFMLAGAFNLDYFSPQAISLILAMALYAIVVPVVSEAGPLVLGSTSRGGGLPWWRSSALLLP